MTLPPIPEKIVFLEGAEDRDPEKEYQKLLEEASIAECGLALPKGFLSVTQIDSYRRCPKSYYFRYIKGIIIPPNIALAEGRAVHSAVAVGHTEFAKSGIVPVDVMLDAHNQAWKSLKSEIDWKAGNEDGDDEDVVLRRDRTFIELYHGAFIPKLKPVIGKDGAPFIELLGYVG